MSFPKKVKSTLLEIVAAMDSSSAQFVKNPKKDFKCNRKLGFAQLIRFFLCMHSGSINHELVKYFYFLPYEIPSSSAFIQQRAKLLPEAFQHILKQFNLAFPPHGFWGKFPLLRQMDVHLIFHAILRILPLFIYQAADQKEGSIPSTPFHSMICFPRDIWMSSSSPTDTKMNLLPSANS